ncbi:hypothetical protein [Paenibacillus tundrae]|uniref:hypothetical protein n=1 Tax=Paenibacillus tundrae TaxID=528187 RepID=UPI0030D23AAD
MSFEFDFESKIKNLVPELTNSLTSRLDEALKNPKYTEMESMFGETNTKIVMMSNITLGMSAEMTLQILKDYHRELSSYLENQK